MAPNIQLLGLEAGDLLKYETALKEIDRYGAAVLRVRLESFPVESISSSRAQRVYDWICSVGRQEMVPTERTERMRLFLHQLSHNKADLCSQVDEALRRAGFEVARPALASTEAMGEQRREQERAQRREFESRRDGLLGQITRSGRQTMGLFLSMQGWSANVVQILKQNPNKSILLADGMDLRAVLSGALTFPELIDAKERRLNLAGEPSYSALELLRDRDCRGAQVARG